MKLLIFLFIFTPTLLFSQINFIDEKIVWHENVANDFFDGNKKTFFSFDYAQYDEQKDFLAFYSKQIYLGNLEIFDIELVDAEYESINSSEVMGVKGATFIGNQIDVSFTNSISRKQNYGVISFIPIIYNKTLGVYQKVIRIQLKVLTKGRSLANKSGFKMTAQNSVLATGDWYKIAVTKDGVF